MRSTKQGLSVQGRWKSRAWITCASLLGMFVWRPAFADGKADTALDELRRENMQLKQAMASCGCRPSAAPSTTATVEEVLKGYFAAASWRGRLPFVMTPAAVEARMAEHYGSAAIAGNVAKIHKPDDENLGLGERLTVHVDLDDELGVAYVLVRTKDGLRIDWLESMAVQRRENDAELIHSNGLEGATIEVNVLGVEQKGDWTTLTIEVTNRSHAFIKYLAVSANIYDAQTKFLGNHYTNMANLRPGDSTTTYIGFRRVRASAVKSWKLRLDDVTIENEDHEPISDGARYFTLKELR